MKKIYLFLFTILSILFTVNSVNATHIMGGDIGYTYLGGDSFTVRVKLYRDCSGINNANTQLIYLTSGCYNKTFSAPLISNTGNNVTPVCSLAPNTTCDSTGGAAMVVPVGVQEYIYEAVVSIPDTLSCKKFTFSVLYCCRNPLITNIASPLSHRITLLSELDRTLYPGNSSPSFYNPAPIFGTANQVNYFDFSAIDLDGDSLVYSLYHPHNYNGTSVNYISGLSYLQPFLSTTPVLFDSTTGIMTVNPNGSQVTVVGVRVEKYRAGNMIGFVEKDIQIIITNDSNSAPEVSGIDSTNVDYIVVNPGDTISFFVYGSDIDSLQNLTMSWNQAIAGATFTISGTASAPVGHFYWIVDSSHMQFRPHLFGVSVKDDECPIIADRTRFFRVYVLNPNVTDVWPGDADNNLTADVYDLLPIGIAYGTSGPVRTNASTNWIGQPANNWPLNFLNALNYKFADANGDGVIDSLDIDVVNLNYGMTHQKNTTVTGSAAGDLYIEVVFDTLLPGETAIANIYLGDHTSRIENIYGIAFKLFYDGSIVQEGSVKFIPASWMGSTVNNEIIYLYKEMNGGLDIGMTRTNQANKSGFGKIGVIQFTIRSDVNGPDPYQDLTFSFSGLKAISNNEQPITLTTGYDIVQVQAFPTGITDLTKGTVNIYPNPAKDILTIETEAGKLDQLTFFDIQGRLIFESNIDKGKATLNVKDIPAGVYVLTLKGEAGSISKKVIIE